MMNSAMKGCYHSLIPEAFEGVNDESVGYDSDQNEKLMLVWTEENVWTKKCRKVKE
jgi:hypothetical protein